LIFYVSIFSRSRVGYIGDQGDRHFWRTLKSQIPALDIVIDDGGHLPEQQRISLEELLPHLPAGGVYICEDIHGGFNEFATYVHALAHQLNRRVTWDDDPSGIAISSTALQAGIASIHLYPFIAVLERTSAPVGEFVCPRRGTEWPA
jgi:hypothetical protein